MILGSQLNPRDQPLVRVIIIIFLSRSLIWLTRDLIREITIPGDVAFIRSISIGTTYRPVALGWHYTKSSIYTVKSGYNLERQFSHSTSEESFLGPYVRPPKARVWKLQCPSKLRHFIWQVLMGCVSVTHNLRSRGINCDTHCARCGLEESINHALFECPLALQTWALSQIQSAQGIFWLPSIFSNIDYLFWRLQRDSPEFPWIIWYIES